MGEQNSEEPRWIPSLDPGVTREIPVCSPDGSVIILVVKDGRILDIR